MEKQENDGCYYRNLSTGLGGLRTPLSQEEIMGSHYVGKDTGVRQERKLLAAIRAGEGALGDLGAVLSSPVVEETYHELMEGLKRDQARYQELILSRR